MIFWPDALEAFEALPLSERLFVRARAFSAPLEALAHRVTGREVLDVGCGHGVLVAMLAHRSPERRVTGIDPDPRKLQWANRSVGRLPNVTLRLATIEQMPREAFDSICIADVLYLLPPAQWHAFFAAAHAALRPGGRLLLKEAEDDGSWRVTKALWQERLMVSVLRRTQSSGAIAVPRRELMLEALTGADLALDEAISLAHGYTTPHVLFIAHKPVGRSTL